MRFGICYYPEHWPQERWPVDADLMKSLGLELVRLAEFSWSRLEPQPGVFDFAWLDRAMEILQQAGLKIILGTPTAAPPAWLSRNYPDTLPVDDQGRVRNFGSRRHYCPNNPTYRAFTRQIVTALGRHYCGHPGVVAWQIDNEFGGGRTARCYCPHCGRAFQQWLERRYGSLAGLNQAWGNVFWSMEITEWGQIAPPLLTGSAANPSQVLDYYRFCSDSFLDYQDLQLNLLRESFGDKPVPVTHNFMGLFFQELDTYKLAAPLDFVSLDNYPTAGPDRIRPDLYPEETLPSEYAYDAGDPAITGMELDLARSWKGANFWIMEQQPGHVNWGTHNPGVLPETVRLWTWHALAGGADTLLYFRWRSVLFAQEQYHSGILRHDASPDVGYAVLQRLDQERELLAEVAAQPLAAQVALVFDYDDNWAIQIQPHRKGYSNLALTFLFYRAFQRLGIPVDFVRRGANLAPYRLVCAPGLHISQEGTAAWLSAYVAQGGCLVMGLRTGFKTPSNTVVDQPLPGAYRQLSGVHVTAWHAIPPNCDPEMYRLGSEHLPEELLTPVRLWAEALEPLPGFPVAVVARWETGPFTGQAALVEHNLGAGQVISLGWYPTLAQCMHLVEGWSAQAGVHSLAKLPPGVVAARRGKYTILLNFTSQAQNVQLEGQLIQVGPRAVWLTPS